MINAKTQKEIDRLSDDLISNFAPPEFVPGCKVTAITDKDQYATDNGWIVAICGRHNNQRCRWTGQLSSIAVDDYVDVLYYPSYKLFVVFGQGGTGAAQTGNYLLTSGVRDGATSTDQTFINDIKPQSSTNGLNARFERLFGDDVPANSYKFTQRQFLVNSGADQLGFEDSQGTPYSIPGGSNFSINLAGNADARSDIQAHWLRFFSQTTGSGTYLQWANATTKNTYAIILSLLTVKRASDTYLGEIRFWNAASFASGPQSTDTWWAIRFNYYATTYPDSPLRVEHYYSTTGTDGLTFALGTGTLASSFQMILDIAYYFSIIVTTSGSNGALIARFGHVDAPNAGINKFGTSVSGAPQSFNYARLYLGENNQFGAMIDEVKVS